MHNGEQPELLVNLCRRIRHDILIATTQAGSGHPTSSLSSVELMVGLVFSGIFRFDADHPDYPSNDRLIFSKGHAAPLLYSLWALAGRISPEELLTLRKFNSRLEGHPTPAFPYAEVATGSLGHGLSVGIGMAINAKYLDKLPYRTYVLLGDSEMAEGSNWEAMQIAAHYKLDNLIGIIDVNRLGQRGETMYGHNLNAYEKRVTAFGWETIVAYDGHSLPEVIRAYQKAAASTDKPVMIIAKTVKGKGVSFLENKEGWHGKTLSKEELKRALGELGDVNSSLRGDIALPENVSVGKKTSRTAKLPFYAPHELVSTRQAYGNALVRIFPKFPEIVVLDGEVSNSTFSQTFQKAYPKKFFEMYIAEQNMVGAALGLSQRGKIPFVSTFAAFFSRAGDQLRMARYSNTNIKCVGSHAGVSIGQDGPSQMGLEDIALFRTLGQSVVLYPCDAISCERLVEEAARWRGMVYLRTTRRETPLLYPNDEPFPVGGSKILRQSTHDRITVAAAGVTVFEALAAYDALQKEGITIRVIDLYSVKPIDATSLQKAARETRALVVVEDHYAEGGVGEAVMSALSAHPVPVHSLAVRKIPKSGRPEELLDYEELSAKAIIKKIKEIV